MYESWGSPFFGGNDGKKELFGAVKKFMTGLFDGNPFGLAGFVDAGKKVSHWVKLSTSMAKVNPKSFRFNKA